eukprot:SAG31_NODE_1846_length_7103_cov_82.594946_9_plen_181_part_00
MVPGPMIVLGLALCVYAPVAAVITVHNNSNCCCQNIYPRSAANLVSTVDECIASCDRDALCHAAIMIRTDVKGQCQLTGPAPVGKSCCIHKPHFDSLNAVPATAGETTIDMGTSHVGTCPCNSSGWDVPCTAPVPGGCMMYRGSGSGVADLTIYLFICLFVYLFARGRQVVANLIAINPN